jgi:hypothetical protein
MERKHLTTNIKQKQSMKTELNKCTVDFKTMLKVQPITGHESPEGEQRYRSTHSLITAIDVR